MKKHLLFLLWMALIGFPCQNWAQSPSPCQVTLPYQCSFSSSAQNNCWTVLDNNNDGKTFTLNSLGYAVYSYSSTNVADDWLISPVFPLTGNEHLCFDYKAVSTSYFERFQVFAIGNDTIPLTPVIETNQIDYQSMHIDLTALSGPYQIGFHCVSTADQFNLYFTNIHVFLAPMLMFNKSDMDFGLQTLGSSSAAQQVIMTSFGNSSPITVTAPAGFEVSLDQATFGSSLVFASNGSDMRKDTFYVRYTPVEGGPSNKKLLISSGTLEKQIALHGVVHACNDTMSIPFAESFEDSFTYCWTILDQDGDGYTWEQYSGSYTANSGIKSMYSPSHYDSYTEQNVIQDNWLISQPVYISDASYLSYYVDARSWSYVNYSVYISTTGQNVSDFSLLYSDSVHVSSFLPRMISLADYTGQTVYLAFRTNSTQDCLLDDITIATLDDHPIMIAEPSSIDCEYLSVGYGEIRSFQVKTYGPVQGIEVSGTEDCDFSLDGISFASTIALPDTGGTVFVRITLSSTGWQDNTVTISAANTEAQKVHIYARGLNCYNTIPYTHYFNNSRNDCWTTENVYYGSLWYFSPSNSNTYVYLRSQYPSDNWLISPLFQLDGNQFGFFDIRRNNNCPENVFLQVYAIRAIDTIPISPKVQLTNEEYESFYFDLSSLQGTYHVGIRIMADTISHYEYVYITNFNVLNLTPEMAVLPDTVDFGLVFLEVESPKKPVAVTTVDISNPIVVTVSAPFEVSIDGGMTFGSTKTIPANSANVQYDTVLVRMTSSTSGVFTGWMTVSTSGFTDSVYLMGRNPDCHNTIPYSYSFTNSEWNECWTIVNANNDGSTFSMDVTGGYARYMYNYSQPADDWLLSPYFHFDGHQYGSIEYRVFNSSEPESFEIYALGADTILLTPVMEVNNTYYTRLLWDNLSTLNGNYRIGIHCVSERNAFYLYFRNFNIFTFPHVALSDDSLNFSLINVGSSSPAQSVVMEQTGVSTPITVTAPTHFEVSTDGVNFGPQCTIPASSAFVATDTLFVRFTPLQGGPLSGSLIILNGNASDTLKLTGLARNCADTLQLPFSEDFEGNLDHCWTILDQDGDGYTWYQRNYNYVAFTGNCSMFSESHYDDYNDQNIVQDNWLISQPIYISDTAYLSYYMRSYSWYSLDCPVYVSTTGNNVSDFSLLAPNYKDNGTYYTHFLVSLADYVGQTIYVAFRLDNERDCALDHVSIATLEDNPQLLVSTNYIKYGYISVGLGEVRSFQVETFGPVENIVVSGTNYCDFSLDGLNYTNTLSLPNTGGIVYVRLTPTSNGSISARVTVSADNAVSQMITIGANALECYTAIPYLYNFNNNNRNQCWSSEDVNRDGIAFAFSSNNSYSFIHFYSGYTLDDWLISPLFQLDGNQFGFFDYWGATYNYALGEFQVYAIGSGDTIPISPIVKLPDSTHKRIYFDLSSLQGNYHVGIHVLSDSLPYSQYFYLSNFNIQNLTPMVIANPDTLNMGSEAMVGIHQGLPVEVVTVSMANPVTITTTTPFEVSVDGGATYGTSMTIPANNAMVTHDTVLVRMIPTDLGDYTGWMMVSANGISDSVYLKGKAHECYNTIPYIYSFNSSEWNECWTVINANNDNRTFYLDTNNSHVQYVYTTMNPADEWLISPYFQMTGMQYGSIQYKAGSSTYHERFEVYAMGADTILLTPVMDVNNTAYKTLTWDLAGLNGLYRIAIHCVSEVNQLYLFFRNFQMLPLIPSITFSEETIDFGKQTVNTVLDIQTITLNTEAIFTPVTVTAPSQYEISLDGTTFTGSVTLPANSAAFTVDTLFVRFNTNTVGQYNDMLIASAGNIADTSLLYGEVFDCALVQSLPIVEDFEDELSPCWTTLDMDGDGQNWMLTSDINIYSVIGHESPEAYASRSWNSTPLNPDDWLVSPLVAPTDNTVLSFFVKGVSSPEHFAVYVSTDKTLSSFLSTTPIMTGTSTNQWKQYIFRLNDYVGDSVYVAFRHYNSYNCYLLLVDDISITDMLVPPALMVEPQSLTFGMVGVGMSATDSITLDGFGFNSVMIASTTAPFTISTDGVTFSNILALPPQGGTLYVRYAPTAEGTHDGTLTITPTGADVVSVDLHGVSLDCQNTVPYTYQFNNDDINNLCWTVENANQDDAVFHFSTSQGYASYSYNYQNAADDWLISPEFTFNGYMYGFFDYWVMSSYYVEKFEVFALGADTIRLTPPMEVDNILAERQMLDLTSLTGPYKIGIHCISEADRYTFYVNNFNILQVTPAFMTESDSLDFGVLSVNTQSDPQQVVLTSLGIYTPITITAPSQFEISLDGVNFSSSLVLPFHVNVIVQDTFYVRFSPTVEGTFNSPLTISSNNLQKTMVLMGFSRDCDAVQAVPFVEDFEGYGNYCWTIVDGDNDGYIWYHDDYNYNAHSGTGYMYSESYNTTSLCPDNWLISQPIQLPETPAMLSFWVRAYMSSYADEHYSVYVSTTGNSIQDFTHQVFTSVSTYSYQQQNISLRDFVGETIYIAIRHHNTCDEYRLFLDDISIQLDTTPQLPMVATDSVMAITQLSAAGVGHIVFDGNTTITDRGFCWSTSPDPTMADNHISSPTPSESFMGMLIGLSEHTTYYLRAYATNSFGTAYGENVSFTTLCGPATYTNFTQTACESFEWNGISYTQTGDYVQNLQNVIGCDSIVTMHLTIYHGDTTEFTQTACESYTWAGTTYTLSGAYTKTFPNVHGCDSIVTLHLTIHHGSTTEFSATACDSYTWDNTTYVQSGAYTKTFPNVHGCDSIVTLHLTIHHGSTTEFSATACDSYTWDNTTYVQSGDYTKTFPNVYGCDSVVTLHLTVYPSVTNEVLVSCPDSCYEWNGQTYCASGDYTQVLQTVHGCDSTVLMHLTITVGIEDPVVDRNLQVYPNPTNGLLSIRGTSFSQVLLFDAYGKRIGVWNAEGEVTQIDLSSYAPGVYFVKVMDKQQIVGVKKVIKQ